MYTFRKVGIVGGAVAMLFSATLTFAETAGTKDVRITVRASSTISRTDGEAQRQQKMEAQKQKMHARVAEIKDKAKQAIAERLTTQFDSINKVETEHFMKLLAHYSAILQKIQDHATVLAGKGKDIATTNTEITSAKSAIMTAQAAVTAQAAKTYVLDTTLFKVTSATTTAKGQDQLMKGFRTAFQKLHTSLKADLMALRNGPMKDARAAVKAALEALIKISSVNDGAEAGATSTNATSTN